jgi:LysR family nitrogen assimilation transcriptional regulator
VLDLKDLRCFVAVYECGGFARAAAVMITAQSNVSARVLRLEQLIGAPLFERRHRSVLPTAKGELLYRHAKRIFLAIEELEASLDERQAI